MDKQGERNDLNFAAQAPLAEPTQRLVGMNKVEKGKLPHIFLTAAKTAAALREMADKAEGEEKLKLELQMRDEHKKAAVTACRLSMLDRGFIQGLHDDLVFALKDPNMLNLEGLKLAIAYEMVLLEQEIIRNGKIFEIAEGIADGLANTKDPEKTEIMTQLGFEIMHVLPGGSGGDIAKIYDAVFAIAKHPNRLTSYSGVLNSRLDRLKEGDPNLKRLLNDTVIQRMKQTLDDKPKLLSDGDMNLPRPRRMKPRSTMEIVADIGRGLARRRKAHSV